MKLFDQRMSQLAETGIIHEIFAKWGDPDAKFGENRYGKE